MKEHGGGENYWIEARGIHGDLLYRNDTIVEFSVWDERITYTGREVQWWPQTIFSGEFSVSSSGQTGSSNVVNLIILIQ